MMLNLVENIWIKSLVKGKEENVELVEQVKGGEGILYNNNDVIYKIKLSISYISNLLNIQKYKKTRSTGLEPAISGLGVLRLTIGPRARL